LSKLLQNSFPKIKFNNASNKEIERKFEAFIWL
jgi:hypothetical protein